MYTNSIFIIYNISATPGPCFNVYKDVVLSYWYGELHVTAKSAGRMSFLNMELSTLVRWHIDIYRNGPKAAQFADGKYRFWVHENTELDVIYPEHRFLALNTGHVPYLRDGWHLWILCILN